MIHSDAHFLLRRGWRIRRACVLLLAAAALPPRLAAQSSETEECAPVDAPAAASANEPEARPAVPPPHRIFDARTTRLALLIPFAALPAVGYVSWWKRDFGVRFHTVGEGWFGRDSYAGGADKASHFYWGTVGQEAFSEAFRKLGHPEREARWLAAADTLVCALVVELGDSMTSYGFTWQDAAATLAGAGAYAFVSSRGLQDIIGFRFGIIPDYQRPAEGTAAARPPGLSPLSRDPDPDVPARYSQEIYTVDLKLKGFLPRIGVSPAVGRFFFLSLTYGTKGYKAAPPDQRERNIGLEVGLSFSELFRAVGVKETTWWGNALLIFLDHFRVPYSGIGIRYDANSGRWSGPDAGNIYDRGPKH